MNQVQIPTNRLPMPSLQGAPIGPDGMQRVIERVLRRHLYTGPIPLSEFLALDDPPDVQHRGGRGRVARMADTKTEFDQCPRYEIRYTDNLYVAEQGVVGHTTEEQFERDCIEWMWTKEWEQIGGPAGEQPNGEWKMVACAIRQVDNSVLVPVPGPAPDMAAKIRAFDEAGFSNMSIRQAGGGGIAGYRSAPATRWVVPMVFVDVSRSELVDPAKVRGTRDGATSALTEYILTRQLRHMTPTMRANRKKGTDLIEEFIRTSGELLAQQLEREAQRISNDQLTAARQMLEAGLPEALVAQAIGVELESLRRALVGALVPTAK